MGELGPVVPEAPPEPLSLEQAARSNIETDITMNNLRSAMKDHPSVWRMLAGERSRWKVYGRAEVRVCRT